MSDWQTRLEQACTDRRFREFVQGNVLAWCEWKREETWKLAKLQHARAEETPDEQAIRWAAIDALESNPRFLPAAVADEPRLTLDAKCTLLAAWRYREYGSRDMCPESKPAATEPLDVILLLLDINPDRASIDFTDIGAIAVDVLEAFTGPGDAASVVHWQEALRPADELPKNKTGVVMTWQEVQRAADMIRIRGEPFTSYRKMASTIGCNLSVLHNAIDKHGTAELQEWASKQRGPSRLNAAPEVAAVAFENMPQTREPDPADITENADVEVAMAYLLDQAGPDARAQINAMSPAQQRLLAETLYQDPDQEEQSLRHRRAKRLRRD